jgi:hypothetical protein
VTYDVRIKFWDDEAQEGVWSTEAISFIKNVNQGATAPDGLRVHDTNTALGTQNPITVAQPFFSATFRDPDSGDIAQTYQLQVKESTDDWTTPYWDSGSGTIADCTNGSQCADVLYEGAALTDDTTYDYRFRFWDDDGEGGIWSVESASFTTDYNVAPSAPDQIQVHNTN